MPSCLSHLYLCDSIVKVSKETGKLSKDFVNAIERFPAFTRLGSLGPDLPYFETLATSAIKTKLDFPEKVEKFAYMLHSVTPGLFVEKLFKILRQNLQDNLTQEDDASYKEQLQNLAFAIGYLTHAAADTIIHPEINKIAGCYYTSDKHKKEHRNAEIHQDVYLFNQMQILKEKIKDNYSSRKKRFKDKDFEAKIDLFPENYFFDTGRTNKPFRVFIQRAFLETYSVKPTEQQIEDWVDGLWTALKFINLFVSPHSRVLHRTYDDKIDEYFTKINYFNPSCPITKLIQKVFANKKVSSVEKTLRNSRPKSLASKSVKLGFDFIHKADTFYKGGDFKIKIGDLSDPPKS